MTAAARDRPGIAVGDAIGANITMLTLALGLAALVAPLPLRGRVRVYAAGATITGAAAAAVLWDGARQPRRGPNGARAVTTPQRHARSGRRSVASDCAPSAESVASGTHCEDLRVTSLIRPGRAAEGEALQEIERLAGQRFRDLGLAEVADDEPLPVEALASYAEDGRSWVAVDDAERPLGYVLVDIVDRCAHIEQLSVRPDHQGAGLGRALVERVRTWAKDRGLSAITLTTFTDVPWNAPLYRHLGFRELSEDELGPQLREVRDTETAHGLDPANRVCMWTDA